MAGLHWNSLRSPSSAVRVTLHSLDTYQLSAHFRGPQNNCHDLEISTQRELF